MSEEDNNKSHTRPKFLRRRSSERPVSHSRALTETSSLVQNTREPIKQPTVTRGQYLDPINNFNLVTNVQNHITATLASARDNQVPMVVIFAFTIIGNKACRVADCDAFEADKTKTQFQGTSGKAITLNQLCIDARKSTRIYTEVNAIFRFMAKHEPGVHMILEKWPFRQANQVDDWFERLRTPSISGHYYTIICDFVQCHHHQDEGMTSASCSTTTTTTTV
jgi:hypothetical protein